MSVVSHSHWDREWYAPFEEYRMRLVAMMDGLLDLLESDPPFTHFHLDGQVAMVDDYLECRPEAEDRMRALLARGRLSIGPWYVLMDEFCVSGETILRNLQLGLERAAEMGAGPAVGYLPDMFGHVSQMPQVLRAAGIGDAVVWRGVPTGVNRTGFWWEAPDGSRVRAEYLPVGYAGGAFLPRDPDALVRRVAAHETEIASFLRPDWPMLLMNGGDHQNPQSWLPEILEAANKGQEDYAFRQTSLADHLMAAPREGLPLWRGELRSGHRAPILMGVLSNRVDIKLAAAMTEQLVERQAEPLAALWLPPDLWPVELDRVWLEMIRNSAHDSICACSADEVGRAVLHRYDTARALAADVVDRALAIAGVALTTPGPAVVNSLPYTRTGLVKLTLPGTDALAGTQQLEVVEPGRREVHGRGRDLAAILGGLTADGWLGPAGRATGAELSAVPGPLIITLEHDPTRRPDRLLAPTLAEAWARAGAGPDEELTVVVHRGGWQRVLARAVDVPGWGWSSLIPECGAGPEVTVAVPDAGGPVVLDNGKVRVEVDPLTGTFSLNGVAGQNQLVDEADAGDTYNFAPLPGDLSVADPVDVSIEVAETGPLRASVRVRRHYQWPIGLADGTGATPGGASTRSPAAIPVEVVSEVELRSGEKLVRVTTSFDNRCRDHRVRALFPLESPVTASTAESAFGCERRGLRPEGGRLESPLATFPSRRFVAAGDLCVTHQGLLEYELVDDGSAIALTLLRATGVISRPSLPTRPNVAGPPVPVRDAQVPGPLTVRYALAPDCPDPFRLADETWTPLLPFESSGDGHLADRGSRLGVDPAGCVVSALLRRAGAIQIRLFNPSPAPATVRVADRSGTRVDLRGREVGRWRDSVEVNPGQIVTIQIDDASLD